ncbi:helicase RepA family protein [Methylohalobius crimeensis]|uniref:helicase RepA family protein n=1 Tax=Methylohalobius crimeensis TaxID=244365 RepID=UPI0003B4FFC0|nr:helicase RepA family protein [Methylohalobius crimeensis]
MDIESRIEPGHEFIKTDGSISIIDAINEDLPELDFVIPGLLAGSLGLIVSPGGVGKSNLALQLCASVATGIDFCEISEKEDWIYGSGKASYITAEDPVVVILHRIKQFAKKLDIGTIEKLDENLSIYSIKKHFLIQNGEISEHWVNQVHKMVQGKRLIILDTMRRFHLESETDDSMMMLFLSVIEGLAEETGCTVLICHHMNKSSLQNGGGGSQTAARGHSVLTDNVRYQINLNDMSVNEAKEMGIDKTERLDFVKLEGSKINYGKKGNECWFRRGLHGVLSPANSEILDLKEAANMEKERNRKTKKGGSPHISMIEGNSKKEEVPEWLKGIV